MGRKIPGKKHRGVKDPLIQHAQREESLRLKTNAPPIKPDEQEIPKSLERVMLLKKLTKEGKFNIKKKRNRSKHKLIDTSKLMGREIKFPGMSKPDKTFPKLIQKPGEHDHQFIARVGRMTQEMLNEMQFEEKYGVSVKRNTESGEVDKIEKKIPDEVDAMFEKKRIELMKPKFKKKQKDNDVQKLSKSAKFRLRKAEKKQKLKKEKESDHHEFEKLVDHVGFGEVAHQPPQFLTRPKKAVVTDLNNKPGRKSNLLLNKLLNPEKQTQEKKDLTVKRKELSLRDRTVLEAERINVVAAYRKLKASKV